MPEWTWEGSGGVGLVGVVGFVGVLVVAHVWVGSWGLGKGLVDDVDVGRDAEGLTKQGLVKARLKHVN